MIEAPVQPKPIPMLGTKPAWWDWLGRMGYPTNVIVIDFETYFDQQYKLMGRGDSGLSTIEYVMDARYEEIGKSILHITQPFAPNDPTFWWGGDDSYIRHLTELYGPNWEGATVVAQNFAFDGTILTRKYGITPANPVDLLGLARHEEARDYNDLDSLAERYGLPRKGDTSQFKGLHLNAKWDRTPGKMPTLIHRGMNEDERAAMNQYANHDCWLEFELFQRLLPRLSNPAVEARLMAHTLRMFWKPILVVDPNYALDLKTKMQDKAAATIVETGHTEDEISGNKTFTEILGTALTAAGDSITKYTKFGKPYKDGRERPLLAIAKDDAELEVLLNHPDCRVKQLMAARVSIKSWPLHISRVERIMRQAEASGGALPVPLKYHGAHTGRWSGGEKINLQNLARRGDPLVVAIRGLLMAPEGFTLVIVDASAIEARVLAWLAGQEDLCQMFRDGREIYCEYAGRMVGRKLRKARKSDIKQVAAYLTKMRNMGKVQVLGCGYGMGADKCVAFAASSYGVELTLAEALDLVKSYRKSVPHICAFWGKIEAKFKAAAKYHHEGELNGLKFHYEEEGDITVITLPNGRTLKYPHVRVSLAERGEQIWMPDPMKPGHRTLMWGGFLTENVVQAISRDILAEGVLNSEVKGWPVALHVHDEIVAVVKDEEAPAALTGIIDILGTAPAWAPACPLAAEGQIAKRYQK